MVRERQGAADDGEYSCLLTLTRTTGTGRTIIRGNARVNEALETRKTQELKLVVYMNYSALEELPKDFALLQKLDRSPLWRMS